MDKNPHPSIENRFLAGRSAHHNRGIGNARFSRGDRAKDCLRRALRRPSKHRFLERGRASLRDKRETFIEKEEQERLEISHEIVRMGPSRVRKFSNYQHQYNNRKYPYTNYSFRKGGATSIATKVGLATLKTLGRWKSDAYKYTP